MQQRWRRWLSAGMMIAVLIACTSKPTGQGQQYKDGHFSQPLVSVRQPNVQDLLSNPNDYTAQLAEIQSAAPALFKQHSVTYQAVERWLAAGGDVRQLNQSGLMAYQMAGADQYGNVHFTGYYTPVVQARRVAQGEFRYPLYAKPAAELALPQRADIYAGALGQQHIIAYSNSLMDNFIMEVQGSGYVNFGDDEPLVLFAYAGKNGHPYRSIGRILVERGEVAAQQISLQAIRQWADGQTEQEVRKLLEQNPSFVFFQPQDFAPVRGASSVPLVAQTAVAADRLLIPPGTTLLAEVPLIDNQGKFTGKYQLRLMVALDIGGAIKGHHFDIYQGIGEEAGHVAGYYNHYGRVWVLQPNQT
ncbi:murein transglycosylase A [Serratia microhaemolytica]|uniref:murein transglycosylase A n=1 Tax=Serratia microhaemolytica TaxID=2675110 RepID=UPI000FDF003B|nr:murein transglycosylase A [Serratia microhaemolytica]